MSTRTVLGVRRHDAGVVVVGTGFGCVTHVRALRAAGFEVRPPWSAGTRPRQPSVPPSSTSPWGPTSVDEALDLDGVDAVTVATPPHTHADDHPGRHRAPASTCSARSRSPATRPRRGPCSAAAEAAGVVHLLGCEFRWDAGQATLARAVAAGAVGEPRLATVCSTCPLLADAGAEVPAWWADRRPGRRLARRSRVPGHRPGPRDPRRVRSR